MADPKQETTPTLRDWLMQEHRRLRVELAQESRRVTVLVEALAEIKATVDGHSDQPVAAILDGCIAEMGKIGR